MITEIRDDSGALRSFPPRCRQVLDSAVSLGGRRHPQVDGTSVPGLIWKEAMRGTHETGFVRPDAVRFGACRDACPD
ncbi:hypothetical protein [Planomonospora parontospora]|uniref:hypothetical protein n=1 Tax=Planomonospora parontospora TaxID=58119 RepID=UPI00166FE7F9|nr:hypothetical protein [Planomonospora parontospora]GGL53236.1 hypothetical protein GCM10014719_63180 [Planomonospora parontospora subsp. antibiotica]GII19523.1 hypothetical protein Ppa05_62490 [Planomonospora parontospora subsp. antibiotica]